MNSWGDEAASEWRNRRRTTASDLLFNNHDIDGEDLEFEEAMRLVITMVNEEVASWHNMEPDEFMTQHDIDRAIEDLTTLKAGAAEARVIYHTTLLLNGNEDVAREAVINAFEPSGIEWRVCIAEAVRENNYAELAV